MFFSEPCDGFALRHEFSLCENSPSKTRKACLAGCAYAARQRERIEIVTVLQFQRTPSSYSAKVTAISSPTGRTQPPVGRLSNHPPDDLNCRATGVQPPARHIPDRPEVCIFSDTALVNNTDSIDSISIDSIDIYIYIISIDVYRVYRHTDNKKPSLKSL